MTARWRSGSYPKMQSTKVRETMESIMVVQQKEPRMNSIRLKVVCTLGLLVFLVGCASAEVPKDVAYVSTEEGVAVIDLVTLEVKKKIDVVGKGARGLGITADGKYLLTANKETADVSVIDTSAAKMIRRITVGKNPEFMRIHPNSGQAFVTYEPASTGGPPRAEQVEKPINEDAVAPAEVAMIYISSGTVTNLFIGGKETEGIEFSKDGSQIIVANEGSDTLGVYDLHSRTLVKTIDVHPYGQRPRGVKLSPDGRTYIVTMEFSNNLLVLDAGFNVVKTVATEKSPYGVAFDRAGRRVLIAAARSNRLQVFDAQSYTPIAAIPVEGRCWHFTFTPDDTKILAVCGRSNSLIAIDAVTYKILKVISGLQSPWGAVTFPKAYGSLDNP